MSTENSKTNEPHRFRVTLAGKLNLKDPNKNIELANLSISYTWKNIKFAYNKNRFKISTPTWDGEFDVPDGSYFVPDIQDYLEYIIKNMKLRQIILLCKCLWIEFKIGLFLWLKQVIY